MKIEAFRDIAKCSLGVNRRFRDAYCLQQAVHSEHNLFLNNSAMQLNSNATNIRKENVRKTEQFYFNQEQTALSATCRGPLVE
jgi:hypothetical protein